MDGVTGAVRIVPTGWPSLDAGLNGGLLSKTLTAIAAKSGTGTSALVMNLCLNAAAAGHRCLLLTHDARELCLVKMLAATAVSPHASINDVLHQIGTGDMSEEVSAAAEVLAGLD